MNGPGVALYAQPALGPSIKCNLCDFDCVLCYSVKDKPYLAELS